MIHPVYKLRPDIKNIKLITFDHWIMSSNNYPQINHISVDKSNLFIKMTKSTGLSTDPRETPCLTSLNRIPNV